MSWGLFANAQELKDVTLLFNLEDYSIYTDAEDSLSQIVSSKQPVFYMEDTQKPSIPFMSVSIKIPSNKNYVGFTYKMVKQSYSDGIYLNTNPKIVPANNGYKDEKKYFVKYPEAIYPEENVRFEGINNYGPYKVLNFNVSPWIFNSQNHSLDFVSSITLSLELSPELKMKNNAFKKNSIKDIASFVDAFVLNNGDYNDIVSHTSPSNENLRSFDYPYLLITADSLVSSFLPLLNWKTKKGVRAKVITIEEVDSLYSGSSLQVKLKRCLFDQYNNGLEYVLLGGDDTIVPVMGCYGKVIGVAKDKTIPTDLFYACFSGRFDWNANEDDIIGGVSDSVDFSPSIYVSRIPIRTIDDVTVFVNRQLRYEQNTNSETWNKSILMSGTKLWNYCSDNPSISDAQAKSENLYLQSIEPYWNGQRKRFYDTYTDFSSNSNYQFNATNLLQQLNNGYGFVDVVTHGHQTNWVTDSIGVFDVVNAYSIVSNHPTVITTMACFTNAFDDSDNGGHLDPCLSEAIIRNPNSNVVAYLGCSRQGWGYNSCDSTLGKSLQYEASFYKYLFSNTVKNRNWARIVALAKAEQVAKCYDDGGYRWLQMGLNPIGDPEMPIYIDTPRSFDMSSITFLNNGIVLNTGEPDCRVCIMSKSDNGTSVYNVYEDVQNVEYSGNNQDLSICITKQNFVPKVYDTSEIIYIQNEEITDDVIFEGSRIFVGTNVTNLKPSGNVSISNCNVIMKANEVNLCPQTTVNAGASLTIVPE